MYRIAFLLCLCLIAVQAHADAPALNLQEMLDQLRPLPDWFDQVTVDYDLNQPWKEARLHIRKLLAERKSREAIKLTWIYAQKGDIGDGSELPLYIFMGGEFAWAIRAHEAFLAGKEKGYTHSYLSLAACYRHFGQYEKALAVVQEAMKRLPDPPWQIFNRANIEDYLGDLYAEMGQSDEARKHYREAIRLYPTSDQPWGRHELHRRAAKVQSKLDLLDLQEIESGKLRDGVYRSTSLAYAGDMHLTVTIRGGKIEDIQIEHQEKIDQGATKIVPQRIIKKQSLKVDGVTGATVTYGAIIDGVFQVLKQAGLQ